MGRMVKAADVDRGVWVAHLIASGKGGEQGTGEPQTCFEDVSK